MKARYRSTHAAGALADNSCNIRASWVCAARGKNSIHTVLRRAAEWDVLQVIDDQFGVPIDAEFIAGITIQVLPGATARPERAGLYRLDTAGETTWHGYAPRVIEQFGAADWSVTVAADVAIALMPAETLSVRAARSRNSRLNSSRMESAFELTMPDGRHVVYRAMGESDMGKRYGEHS